MTTTELIELLKAYEYGGATGRPREVMFLTESQTIYTDGVEVVGSGDGLLTELYLSLPGAERKKGRWIGGENGRCSVCGHSGCASDIWTGCNGETFCPNCGVRIIHMVSIGGEE